MRAIILSAGLGKRLRPLTADIPKPLVCAGGMPMIVRNILRLRECGVCALTVNISHLGGMIRNALGDGSEFGVRVRYSEEETPLGAAGGIRLAIERGLLPANEPFLSVNADIVCDADYASVFNNLQDDKQCRLLMTDNPPANPQGDFSLDDSGLLLPPLADALTYTGVGAFRPQMFAAVPPGDFFELLPLLQEQIKQRMASGEKHEGMWHDTGTPENLQQAEIALAKKQQ